MTKSLHHTVLVFGAICLGSCVTTAGAQDPNDFHTTTSGAMGGIHYGVPLKWSLALGYVLPGEYKDWQPFVGAEPGLGGWRAGLGALKMTNELGGAYVMRFGALRTTRKAWRAPLSATFVGPEFQFMPIFAIGARVGGFFRVGGKGSRALLTSDLNVMF